MLVSHWTCHKKCRFAISSICQIFLRNKRKKNHKLLFHVATCYSGYFMDKSQDVECYFRITVKLYPFFASQSYDGHYLNNAQQHEWCNGINLTGNK